jgi:hypothetical protein
MTPEGKVKAKVKKLFATYGDDIYQFWPVQTGMGAATLDCLACAASDFFSVETKVPGKKLTPRQEATKERMERAGIRVFVVYDDNTLAELKRYLDEVFDL